MPDRFCLSQRIVVAADATARATWAPPSTSRKWKLISLVVCPNETSAANDTNYTSNRAYIGSTAVVAARVTTPAGGALTQGTPEVLTLTGVGTELEVSTSAPLSYRVDAATNGTGVAVDISVIAEFEELRV